MAISRRYKIFQHWLSNKNDVSIKEIIRNVFRPTSSVMAKKYIKEIITDGEDYKIYFKGINNPLFFPKEMNFNSLYQVIVEIFDPREWHFYEDSFTKVKTNDIVVDCGASEGLFGLRCYNRCQKIYLVEPLPIFLKSLARTFKNIKNIEIVPFALSDSIGSAYIDDNNISSSINYEKGQKINLATLDSLFYKQNRPISYLKVDIEGGEMAMLRGGANTIKRYKPRIAITAYHKETDVPEIQEYLTTLNPNYRFKYKGIEERWGHPVMLHVC